MGILEILAAVTAAGRVIDSGIRAVTAMTRGEPPDPKDIDIVQGRTDALEARLEAEDRRRAQTGQ